MMTLPTILQKDISGDSEDDSDEGQSDVSLLLYWWLQALC